jgi:hypothetical protein
MANNMPAKISFYVMAFIFLLSACAPSESALQTAIAQTQAAVASTHAAWTKTPAPTSTPIPTATPVPTATAESLWSHCLLGNTMTKQYYDQLLLQRTCVYGVITKKDEIEGVGTVYNIYPIDKPITYLIVVSEQKALEESFPGAVGILTTADVGDCIVVVGYPSRLDDGSSMFLGVDVRDVPQLISELGSAHPTVQEITTLCK